MNPLQLVWGTEANNPIEPEFKEGAKLNEHSARFLKEAFDMDPKKAPSWQIKSANFIVKRHDNVYEHERGGYQTSILRLSMEGRIVQRLLDALKLRATKENVEEVDMIVLNDTSYPYHLFLEDDPDVQEKFNEEDYFQNCLECATDKETGVHARLAKKRERSSHWAPPAEPA